MNTVPQNLLCDGFGDPFADPRSPIAWTTGSTLFNKEFVNSTHAADPEKSRELPPIQRTFGVSTMRVGAPLFSYPIDSQEFQGTLEYTTSTRRKPKLTLQIPSTRVVPAIRYNRTPYPSRVLTRSMNSNQAKLLHNWRVIAFLTYVVYSIIVLCTVTV
jgi:hypothetical protein